MKRPVHWYEGMFLRPHHFQAAEHYTGERLRESEDWYYPYNWGIRSFEIDRGAIANSRFELRACEARFRDGSKLVIPEEANVTPVDFRKAIEKTDRLVVRLGVPCWRPTLSNVEDGEAGATGAGRYQTDSGVWFDENTGRDEQELVFRRFQPRLLLSSREAEGYETLPIARIMRDEYSGVPMLDPNFAPPLIRIEAWDPLSRLIQSLTNQVEAKANQYAERVIGQSISFQSDAPGDTEIMLRLAAINGSLAALQAMAPLEALHPHVIYVELARLAGQLAIFQRDRVVQNIMPYDHNDPWPAFEALNRLVRDSLEVGAGGYQKRAFEKFAGAPGNVIIIEMEPEWLADPSYKMYLGVQTELSNEECQTVLKEADRAIGSRDDIADIFTRFLGGLELNAVAFPPRALPATPGIVYFEVQRTPQWWASVVQTRTLTLQFNNRYSRFVSESTRELLMMTKSVPRKTKFQFSLYVFQSSSSR